MDRFSDRSSILLTSTKKEVTFGRQKLLLFLSKPQAWYIITARSAVHIISPFGLYLITRKRVSFLRLDDMPQQVADGKLQFFYNPEEHSLNIVSYNQNF